MDRKELLEYLLNVYHLEITISQQKKLLEQMEEERTELKNMKYEEAQMQEGWSVWDYLWVGVSLGGKVGIPILVGVLIFLIAGNGSMMILLVAACILLLLFVLPCVIWGVHVKKKREKQYEADVKRIKEENMAKEAVIEQRLDILLDERMKLRSLYEETREMLTEYYAKDVLSPEYRNVHAIGRIYHYLFTGRCTQLEGYRGAYNVYEKDLQHEMIRRDLAEIHADLVTISNLQEELKNIFNRNNVELSRLNAEMSKLSETSTRNEFNTAVMAYNTKVAAQNTEALKWIKNYQRKYYDIDDFANETSTPQWF